MAGSLPPADWGIWTCSAPQIIYFSTYRAPPNNRWTGDNFNGGSYHTCTLASLTGAILMLEVYSITRDKALLYPIASALRFGAGSQFRSNRTDDGRLRGVVMESTIPESYGTYGWMTTEDLSDSCPYFLRDIATSFFVHAVSLLLELAP